ncbi:NusG domain II-containing protein [uncultured Trichococcus sp.]|uniref:NusG domain II-containing protein n=1 Tax=uncultured Trichococcus sp. TaxID=189665 RepID=UPI0029C8EE76|nr:NusG domain II-containing protein [uncultured Trichococcus sp.]
MRKYLKMIRRGDLLIILFLMAASFLPLGVFSYHQANAESADKIAVISVDGKVVKEFVLKNDGKTETYVFHDDHGHENVIVREGSQIRIASADCDDQLCVRMGAKDDIGETIMCLPNRVLIEVRGAQGTTADDEEALDIIS